MGVQRVEECRSPSSTRNNSVSAADDEIFQEFFKRNNKRRCTFEDEVLQSNSHINFPIAEYHARHSEGSIGVGGDMIQIALHRSKSKRVVVNVGGEKNEILWETINRYPETRLGKLRSSTTFGKIRKLCDDFSLENNEYYFDRDPRCFILILNFYRTGKLHLPQEFCIVEFVNEMNYWEINEIYFDSCCQVKYEQKKNQLQHDAYRKKSYDFKTDQFGLHEVYSIEDFGSDCTAKYRKYIWDLFERPDYWPAKIMAGFSVTFIIGSVITFTLSTIPEFQDISCRHINKTACSNLIQTFATSGVQHDPIPHDELIVTRSYVLGLVEQICVLFFTIEYILRFISCPCKTTFLKSWLNVIDLLAIIPYYLSEILIISGIPVKAIQALLIFRVLRVFKLSRHSTGLQSLAYTFKRSANDLGVLLLFAIVFCVIFSSLVYIAERDVNKSFETIPLGFWWALITMTTVGYGDATPVTAAGKLIGMITAICGVVIVALPIAFTMNNFAEFYERQRQREKMLKQRKSLLFTQESP